MTVIPGGFILWSALVLILCSGCTQVRFSRGQPLECHVEKFSPGGSDCDDVMNVLGPPWMLSRTPEGFAFLYEHVETLENQLGLSFDFALQVFGINERGIAVNQLLKAGTISPADVIRLTIAWEKGDIEALALEFDHQGELLAVGYIDEDLGLGHTLGVTWAISASPKIGSEEYKVSASQFDWGMAMLQAMPENLNRAQDLYLGQAGLPRVPAAAFAGQTLTFPRYGETRREKRRERLE